MTQLRIFISYAREDARDLALRLHDDLQAVGHAAWLDLSAIAGGADWSAAIEDAIEQCDIALTLLSDGAYRSQYCRAEQLRALRKGKRVVPVLVHQGAEIPLPLEAINYLDFSDESRYDAMFRDLLSDLTAGRAFIIPEASAGHDPSSVFRTRRPARRAVVEKRDAAAFRRHVGELRRLPWLGSRYWWPYFLFKYVDLDEAVATLTGGALRAPSAQARQRGRRWDDAVRLYFRPRTPDLYHSEGMRPALQQRGEQIGVPVCLLFDLEAVICQPEVRFSAGDPAYTRRTSATAAAFSELPFELIYHDTITRSDEREEVMQSRRAQVIAPDPLGLEALQYIWLRSDAEYDTLRTLLPPEVWQRWRDKVTARTDYTLFNRRWAYVREALLTAEVARLRFQPVSDESGGVYTVRAEVVTADGTRRVWQETGFPAHPDLLLDLTTLPTDQGYSLRVYMDDMLAYAGRYRPADTLR